jgi:hypothetical protein
VSSPEPARSSPWSFAYRRQRVDEVGAHREATRLHTERFSQAVEQLGSHSPAVQLGGVHALAGLADDALDDSLGQTCIDVLCAYLQLPFTLLTPATTPPTKTNTTAIWPSARSGTRSCASSATTTAAPGNPPLLAGLRLRPHRRHHRRSFDFRGATFSGGAVSFHGAAGSRPPGLLDALGTTEFDTVRLPRAWLPSNP